MLLEASRGYPPPPPRCLRVCRHASLSHTLSLTHKHTLLHTLMPLQRVDCVQGRNANGAKSVGPVTCQGSGSVRCEGSDFRVQGPGCFTTTHAWHRTKVRFLEIRDPTPNPSQVECRMVFSILEFGLKNYTIEKYPTAPKPEAGQTTHSCRRRGSQPLIVEETRNLNSLLQEKRLATWAKRKSGNEDYHTQVKPRSMCVVMFVHIFESKYW